MFLRNELDPRFQLPRDFDAPERLHNALGIALADKFDERYDEFAEEHFEQAIADNDSQYPEAHFNLGALLEDPDRLEEARSHVETSISLWRDRGRLDNAINDYRALVRICAKQDDYDAAVEHAADAIVLCTRQEDDRYSQFVDIVSDVGDDCAPETLASNAYRAALWCVSNEYGITAHELFAIAFRQRDGVSGEPLRRARSAGVGLVALHDVVSQSLQYDPIEQIKYDDPDVLLEDICDHASDLRPPVVDCLTMLTGVTVEGTETKEIDDAIRRRESSAFGRLTSLAL